MFLAAKALLIKKSIYPKTHNGTLHKFIEEYVHKDHFDSELAKNFLRTQNLREHASYGEVDDYSQNVAEDKLKIAKKFLEESKEFLK